MEDRSSKIYFGLCMLVLVWIGVYWAWEPGESPRPRISISQPPEQPTEQQPDPEPESRPQQPIVQPIVEQPVSQQPVEQPDPGPRLIPPEFLTHTVVQGEILQDIAKHYYGQSNLWSAIARANPRIDPLKLRAGMTLRIPKDPNNIQGIVENPETTPNQPAQAKPDAIVEYIVQPGDSLSRIAQRFYGSTRHADFIYESNRDTLRSKDAIRVGQILKLPPLDP